MLGKPSGPGQREFLNVLLKDIVNPHHELALLADKIDWGYFKKEFSKFYSPTAHPSHPIRLMVSLLLLKRLFNISEEQLAEQWVMNPYMQYFSGMNTFQHRFPVSLRDLRNFSLRIGEEGISKILSYPLY
ncbi:MAG: transposase [Chlorobi bacterium]|nr:transposase [Chlorobiota bacterium]